MPSHLFLAMLHFEAPAFCFLGIIEIRLIVWHLEGRLQWGASQCECAQQQLLTCSCASCAWETPITTLLLFDTSNHANQMHLCNYREDIAKGHSNGPNSRLKNFGEWQVNSHSFRALGTLRTSVHGTIELATASWSTSLSHWENASKWIKWVAWIVRVEKRRRSSLFPVTSFAFLTYA